MNDLKLDIELAKTAYNWFHHAYPDYRNNRWCPPEEIMMRNKLERWLISNGE